MVTTFYPPYSFGGDGVYVSRLSDALARRGHSVDVVHCEDAYYSAGGREPLAPVPHHENITVHRLKSRFGVLSPLVTQQVGVPGLKARALRRVFESGAFDVTHFHNVSL